MRTIADLESPCTLETFRDWFARWGFTRDQTASVILDVKRNPEEAGAPVWDEERQLVILKPERARRAAIQTCVERKIRRTDISPEEAREAIPDHIWEKIDCTQLKDSVFPLTERTTEKEFFQWLTAWGYSREECASIISGRRRRGIFDSGTLDVEKMPPEEARLTCFMVLPGSMVVDLGGESAEEVIPNEWWADRIDPQVLPAMTEEEFERVQEAKNPLAMLAKLITEQDLIAP